jgi:hypothetical protein
MISVLVKNVQLISVGIDILPGALKIYVPGATICCLLFRTLVLMTFACTVNPG